MATTPERGAGPSGLAGWAKWAQQVGTRKEVYPDLMEVYPDLLKTKRPGTLPPNESAFAVLHDVFETEKGGKVYLERSVPRPVENVSRS